MFVRFAALDDTKVWRADTGLFTLLKQMLVEFKQELI
jgi:hypothetical protein